MSATAAIAPKDLKELRRQAEDATEAAEEAMRLAEQAETAIARAVSDEDSADKLHTLSDAVADHRRGILSTQELYKVLDGLG